MGWLTWCDFVNRYGLSTFRLYNPEFLRCSVKNINTVDHISDACNLDLWLSELKNIRDRVLTKTNQHVKYESSLKQLFSRYDVKIMLTLFVTKITIVTLTFDLVNPKSIGVLPSLRAISTLHMTAVINSYQEFLLQKWPIWPWPLTLRTQNQGQALTRTN